ncbi:MAG: type VI-B CRISPR-associated RNA-guided ribonuclease Cas13b, partial [Dysgonamonadaceae bacterium]
METDSTKEVQAYNLIETPWYFGAYLNMARHNMFLLINHLTEKFSYLNGEKLTNDEEICTTKHLLVTIFDPVQTIYEDERFKVYKYLVKRHYLPFIKIFHEKNGYQLDSNPIVDYKGLHNFLLSVFNSLNSCRNSFTHYLSVDNTGKKIDERKPILDKNMKSTLEQLFKLAPTFSLKRFEASHEENDFDHLNLYELFHPDSSQLTEHGFYFFINLFLERSYAIKFLKKIRGFKNDSTPSFRATIQAFTAYSLRIPDVKLDVEDKKLSLLLEMLNELQRCPKELHSHLSDEDRKIFQPSLDEKDKSNILLNSTDYENIKDEDIDSLISEITSLRRESNRFPYFALRFIDEFDLLPHIRFQITLGKLHVKSYEKIITGNKKNRRIVETIQAFGKLSDFEHSEDEILRDLQEVGVIEKGCYFEQYAPHYNMENNQLPFYLFDDKKTMKYPSTPTGFISLNDLPKIVILAKLFPVDSKSKKCKVEDIIKDFIEIDKTCYLNYDELQKIKQQLSLIPEEFTRRIIQEKSIKGRNGKPDYLNLHKEINLLTRLNKSKEELCLLTSDELRKLTRDRKELEYINQIRYLHFLDKRKQELQKYLPNGLLVNQLPEQITRYLLNINEPDTEKTIDQKIKAVYDDCNIRLKRIKKETEKPQYEQNIKLGELATFLARDIIKMVVDKDVKQKITSPYYNNLQNKIAYFSISQSEIIALCNELQLFDNNKGHVFLSRQLINKSNNIIDFYKNYLETKCKWITTHLSKEEAIPLSLLKIKEKVGRNDFNHWLSNKSTMPVSLPNTLFDKDVSTYLSKELHKNRMPFNQGDKFSILLSKFLQQDTQPFYRFKRIYFVNGEPKEIDINDLDGKTLKSRYGKQVEKNEKQIRFIQTQDRIIKLLCEHILSEYNSDSHHKSLKLASIVP